MGFTKLFILLFSFSVMAKDLSYEVIESEKKITLVKVFEAKESEIGRKTIAATGEILKNVSKEHSELLGPFYTQTVSVKDSTIKMRVGFLLDKNIDNPPKGLEIYEIPAGKYLKAAGKGDYSESWKLYKVFIDELNKRKLERDGYIYEVQLDDPSSVKPPEQKFEFYLKVK